MEMDIDVDSVCRICLGDSAIRNIYTTKRTHNSIQVTCYEMMSSVFSLKVYEGDGLPSKVCRKCFSNLYSAYKLKSMAEMSHQKLLSYLSHDKNDQDQTLIKEIKIEIVENNEEIIDPAFSPPGCHLEGKSGLTISPGIIKAETSLSNAVPTSPQEAALDTIDDSPWTDDDDDLPLRVVEKEKKSALEEVNKENNTKPATKKIPGRRKNLSGSGASAPGVCDLCGKLVRNMKTHRRTHATEKKVFPCQDCSRVFNDYSGRRRHRAVEHLGQLYYCQICKKHFKHGEGHISFMHSSRPKAFKCVMCDKSFYSQSRLNNHVTVHTKERAFPCSVCGKFFRTKADSNYHRRSVHEKEKSYVCQYCPKAFFSSTKMKEHVRTHTNERIYKCKECGKGFFASSGLRLHEMRHAGIKNVPCTLCNKSFINKGNLRSHMLSHTKEKIHPCKYCGVKFGRSDHRNRHQRTAHENKLNFQN